MTKDKSKRTDYKLYALIRRRHNNELKQLLLDHSHMTIAEASNVQGTPSGKWSARKAQLLAKRYKAAGGGYKS